MCRRSASVCLSEAPLRQHRALPGLPQRLATLADSRHRRGKRLPFVSVLLIACSAVLAGARSFAAIGQWARKAPQEALTRLGARSTSVSAIRVAPSTATVRRIINATCPGGLADLLGADPARSDPLAVDGNYARGSRSGDSPAAHLLAAMTGAGTAVTQLRGRTRSTQSPASPPCTPDAHMPTSSSGRRTRTTPSPSRRTSRSCMRSSRTCPGTRRRRSSTDPTATGSWRPGWCRS
ncbi:transposase family protein [Streptomyces sp. NPDC004296]|uniref:transposase family protein n=1 Tax=Streptomyces sp. NPDC004296 TaxID=3364697 RepID=UPI0036B554DC